jgi:metal-sulfur cluster biosynthetic enzyme
LRRARAAAMLREERAEHPMSEQSPNPSSPDTPSPAPAVTEDRVKTALRHVKDPELNLNIVDLGLVYAIRVDGTKVSLDMSLTSPGCPSGPEILSGAEEAVRGIPGVEDVAVNLVWTPFWTPDRIEPRIRAYLGI